MKTIQSPELDQSIIKLYISGKDTYDVAKIINCSQTFVMNCLKRHNIIRRKTQSYTTKYIANENYFNNIDSENKAYFLGLLYADGNNYIKANKSNSISITLQNKDKIILEKLIHELSPESSLTNIDNKYSRLRIDSKIVSEQLVKLGCVPNKSLILTYPKWLDNKLQNHFIRGYFDGDGSIYSRKPNKNGYINYGWQITSTDEFCSYVKIYLEKLLSIHFTKSLTHAKTNQITTTLSVGGNNQAMKILDWMYNDATVYLPRKYDKYIEFKNYKAVNSIKN